VGIDGLGRYELQARHNPRAPRRALCDSATSESGDGPPSTFFSCVIKRLSAGTPIRAALASEDILSAVLLLTVSSPNNTTRHDHSLPF